MSSLTIDATFDVTSWDEDQFDAAGGWESAPLTPTPSNLTPSNLTPSNLTPSNLTPSNLQLSKLTRASVQKKYAGDVDGTSATEWLMSYNDDGSAAFVGLERIRGTIGGLTGTLVLQHVGEFRDGAAKATLTVVGGTGDLGRATGGGDFLADPAGSISLSLST